jgi:branched-subunit amino acid aminotransferase/4-amino-4-deoxychorismate lyase
MDTLIETVRMRNGAAPLWHLHVRRLATSCRALGVPIPVDLPTPEGGADRVHRLLVSRRGVVAGERPIGSLAPVRLVTSKVMHRAYPHKLVDRERFDRALADAKAMGVDDGVLLTAGGQVAETAVWGLFWWESGHVAAPPLEFGILPGVGRARIVELVGEIQEVKATVDEIRDKPLFVANAVRGILPVASLDGKPIGETAETTALAERFWP